ncbi:MAG TPA: amidohydrolase [Clostridiales bacterium]|nr:amidohydrolase [Clostridiales bacterium]
MIDFPIIDAHVHLWDIQKLRYPWLDDIPLLNRNYQLPDYNAACGPLQVEKIIFMQCECDPAQYRDEVRWATELAENEDPRIAGIVSWAPLEKGEAARPEVEALAGNKRVKGVRRIIQFESDLEFCLRPDFIRGVRMLPDYDLTFDICIAWQHNRNTLRFIEKCPDVRFILDHIGKPDIKRHLLDPWRSEIKAMAEFPNVFCKVSSLATEADHQNWTIEDLKPYAYQIFECFGFDRTVYAGDWPVSTQAASLQVCAATIEQLAGGCPAADLKKLFHDNAEKFYKV